MNGGYQGREWGNCSMALYYLIIQMSKSWVWWLMSIREPQVQGQPELHSDTLLKKKKSKFQNLELRVNYMYFNFVEDKLHVKCS